MNPVAVALGLVAAAVGLNRWLERDERNPEFFTDASGTHPIRHGDGRHKDDGEPYDEGKTKKGASSSDQTAAAVAGMIYWDTAGGSRPEDLEKRLDFTERRLNEGKVRRVEFQKGTPSREATPDEMRAYIRKVRPIVERRKKLTAEYHAVRQEQRDVYQGRLSEDERRVAGQRYKELKHREEAIAAELQRVE